jgi:hypothetical protein
MRQSFVLASTVEHKVRMATNINVVVLVDETDKVEEVIDEDKALVSVTDLAAFKITAERRLIRRHEKR